MFLLRDQATYGHLCTIVQQVGLNRLMLQGPDLFQPEGGGSGGADRGQYEGETQISFPDE